MVLFAAPFILLGFLIRKWNIPERINGIGIVVLLCINLFIENWNGRIDMYGNCYGNYALFAVAAISGSLAIIGIARNLKGRHWVLEYIGNHSFFYLAFHQITLSLLLIVCMQHGWLQDKNWQGVLMITDVFFAVIVVGVLREILKILRNKVIMYETEK